MGLELAVQNPIGAMPPGVIKKPKRREEVNTPFALGALVKIKLAVADIEILTIAKEDIVEQPSHIPASLSRLLAIGAGRINGGLRDQLSGGSIEPAEAKSPIEIR
tara:strand:- start:63 stop:377 length:315 start_codon:yes stop_codon:yes gene_type:complete